jgi:lysozyme family protein
MKNISWILLAVAGLIIIVMIWLWPEPEQANTDIWKKAVADRDVVISQLTDSLQVSKVNSAQEAQKRAHTERRYDSTVTTQTKEIVRLKSNKRVIYIRETEPAVDSLINAQDSLIVTAVNRIDELQGELYTLGKINATIIEDCEARFAAQLEKDKAMRELLSQVERMEKKNRKKVKLLGAGIVAAGVLGLFLGGR